MSANLVFKPRARLLLQLGDQLIKNESIALLELVKNSYDAGATIVDIRMHNLTRPNAGEITVRDNGCGMDADVIENVWLELGSDYKSQLLKELLAKKKRSRRLPLGEKGIGRFSAHKLGNTVEIISRMKGKEEVRLRIDWTDFERARYIHDVPVRMLEREPIVFTGETTGTLIKITKLRDGQWPEGMADIFTKTKRSEVMSRIRGRGNKETELALAKLLRNGGITGWRRNQKIFGKPDFVFRKARLVVFVDGCFWHFCPRHSNMPVNNRAFWRRKMAANQFRDRQVNRMLRKGGWRVIRIWEHDLPKRGAICVRRIKAALELSAGATP